MIRAVIPPTPAVVRRARILRGQALALLFFTVGVLVGVFADRWLSDLRHSAHDEISAAKWQQFEALKADYQERFRKSLTTTKAQAAVIAARIEKEREQP